MIAICYSDADEVDSASTRGVGLSTNGEMCWKGPYLQVIVFAAKVATE